MASLGLTTVADQDRNAKGVVAGREGENEGAAAFSPHPFPPIIARLR